LITLRRIHGDNEASKILDDIKDSLDHETGSVKDLFAPKFRKAMMIGIVLALFSQITGINAIIYYAPEIFKSIGLGSNSAFSQTFIIGVVNTLFTFVALWLVDKQGRRKLLLFGVSGMILCLFAIGLCFYLNIVTGPWLLIFILGYIACFASSLGPIPWIVISEIFPNRTRGTAMSFSTLMLWIGVLIVTQLTPILLENVGGAVMFWIFMVNALFLLGYTWRRIPETKNLTLEEIEQHWEQ
jgi:SP family arabinose:H+ symporter-like MFS transporter